MGKRLVFVWVVTALLWLTGCRIVQEEKEEGEPVEYTVVKKEDLPVEVKTAAEEKKQEEFQMTWQCEGVLYLMRGYGIQSSGGYSIQVLSVTETKEELHVQTKLVGPVSRESQKEAISCPYIVIKVEDRDKKVIFD